MADLGVVQSTEGWKWLFSPSSFPAAFRRADPSVSPLHKGPATPQLRHDG